MTRQTGAWWRKGLAVLLSWALVAATTPVAARADELADEQGPAVVEVVQEELDEPAPEEEAPVEVPADDEQDPAPAPAEEPAPEEPVVVPEGQDEVAAPEPEVSEQAVPAEDEAPDSLAVDADLLLRAQEAFFYDLLLDGQWQSEDFFLPENDWDNLTEDNFNDEFKRDFWGFTVTQAGNVTVSVNAASTDLVWVLYSMANADEDIAGPINQNGSSAPVMQTVTRWLEPGDYRIMVYVPYGKTGDGYYNIKASISYDAKRSLAQAKFGKIGTKTYNGAAQTPDVSITWGGTKLVRGVDYTISYKNNKKAGKKNAAQAIVKGKGQYTGSKTIKFTIKKVKISKAKATVAVQFYSGKAKKPNPTVKLGGNVLKKGTDYKLSYKNNKKAGTATVTITGKGSCTGKKTVKFKIRYNISPNGTVTGYYKIGTTKFTKFVFKKTKKKMRSGKDYKLTVVVNDSTELTYKMVGKGLYTGTTYFTFYK